MDLLCPAEQSKNMRVRDGIIPSSGELREMLRYEPDTGKLYNRLTGREVCATPGGGGYLKGSLNNSRCYAHRVIWKLVHGVEPKFIDHINGNKSDNRLVNLRAVEFADNCRNRKKPANNTSGVLGVSWSFRQSMWLAEIKHDGIRHAKWFKLLVDAENWRKNKEAELGFHENHGR